MIRASIPGAYADLVLVAIAGTVGGAATIGAVTGIPFLPALAVGTLGAIALTLDALFR